MLAASLQDDPFSTPMAPLQPLRPANSDAVETVGLVAGGLLLVGLIAGAAALQAWSYDWDWKCLVANCQRFIKGGRR